MADDEKTQNARDIVAAEWATVLAYGPERVDPIVPRTACGHPALRELFPMVGHGVLYLSRCTQYPWTHDVPTAFPQVAAWLPRPARIRPHARRRGRDRGGGVRVDRGQPPRGLRPGRRRYSGRSVTRAQSKMANPSM